jgi:hypothetical protein
LAKQIDPKEQFMRSGHQILVIRSIQKETPDWANSDAKIQKILLRSFPKLKTNKKQSAAAGRWMRIIHLYFRMKQTRGQISAEMNLNYVTVDTLVRNIKRVAAGCRADGHGILGGKPRGRPKVMPV